MLNAQTAESLLTIWLAKTKLLQTMSAEAHLRGGGEIDEPELYEGPAIEQAGEVVLPGQGGPVLLAPLVVHQSLHITQSNQPCTTNLIPNDPTRLNIPQLRKGFCSQFIYYKRLPTTY